MTKSAQSTLTDTYRETIAALTKERDEYRFKYTEQSEGNKQVALRIKELEAKPDLTDVLLEYRNEATKRYNLYESQSRLLKKLTRLMESLVKKLNGKVSNGH